MTLKFGIVWIVVFVIYIIAVFLLLQRRAHRVVRSSILQQRLVVFAYGCLHSAIIAFDLDFYGQTDVICQIRLWLTTVTFGPLFMQLCALGLFVAWFKIRLHKFKFYYKSELDKGNNVSNNSFFIRNIWIIQKRSQLYFVCGGLISNVLIGLLLYFLNPSTPTNSGYECYGGPLTYFDVYMITSVLIWSTTSLLLIMTVKDAFNICLEGKIQIIPLFPLGVIWIASILVGNDNPVQSEYNLPAYLELLSIGWTCGATIVFPLYMSCLDEKGHFDPFAPYATRRHSSSKSSNLGFVHTSRLSESHDSELSPVDFYSGEELFSILMDKDSLGKFEEYCSSAYCGENVLFWQDCQRFREAESPEKRKAIAVKIVDQFLKPSSFLEVNLDHSIKTQLQQSVNSDEIPEDLFFKAERQVYILMKRDVFARFKRTNSYTLKSVDI